MNIFESLIGSPVPSITSLETRSKLLGPNPPLLLDVREPEEYEAGHVEGAQLAPLGQLSSKVAALPKNREMLVICQSGSRSTVATRQLLRKGYQAVNVVGGMMAWHMADLPVKRGR